MTEEERKKFIQNRVQEHYEEACSLIYIFVFRKGVTL